MKKTLFLIFALLITIWCPLSSETSAEDILHISAFKPYKNGVYLHVNNALSHDDVIIEDEIIELNDILDRLMGIVSEDSNPTSMSSTVVFSYRIEGADEPMNENEQLKYKLTIELGQLKNVSGKNYDIPVLYQLGYFNTTFPGNAGDDNTPGAEGVDGWTITYDSAESLVNKVANASGPAKFEVGLILKGTGNHVHEYMPNWIARGAVGMIIDYPSYEKSPYGIYKATANLKLEVI